jgi:type I restriction enzyme S subunit
MILAKEFPVAVTKRAVAFNQDLKAVKCADFVETEYFYYWLKANTYEILGRADEAGHGTKRLQTDRLLSLRVRLPPLSVQRRIAGILSAYDDLIENNQRRIKILEEMARSLYREWFVNFRFPGHEKVPLVDSPLGKIPQGWEVSTLGELYNTSSGGTPSRKHAEYFQDGTIHWVKSQELLDGFILSTEERITDEALENSSAKILPADTILIALYGATIGKLGILSMSAATNQACCAVLQKGAAFGREFAFLTLLLNRERIIGLRLGAAQQNISQILLRNFQCVKPSEGLVTQFSRCSAPVFDGLLTLQRQIQNLRRTRDLLLPRLLSGSIPLDNLPAEANEIARVAFQPAEASV